MCLMASALTMSAFAAGLSILAMSELEAKQVSFARTASGILGMRPKTA